MANSYSRNPLFSDLLHQFMTQAQLQPFGSNLLINMHLYLFIDGTYKLSQSQDILPEVRIPKYENLNWAGWDGPVKNGLDNMFSPMMMNLRVLTLLNKFEIDMGPLTVVVGVYME